MREMWERLHYFQKKKKAWTRSVFADEKKERQNGTDGGGQQEGPHEEELELVRQSSDFRVEGLLMRRAYYAVMSGDWEKYRDVFLKEDRLSIWASVKVRECYNEAELEDEGPVSIAQNIVRKSTDFLKRILAPTDGHRRIHTVLRVSSLSLLPARRLHLVGLVARRRQQEEKEAMQVVVCSLRRPIRLKGPAEQSLGHTRQHVPPKCQHISGTRGAARNV